MAKRFDLIKDHFEKEAAVYDKLFFKVAPHYEEMLDALVKVLPLRRNGAFRALDLGCGTGNVTAKLVSLFPRARVTCLDMAENMIKMAKAKFQGNPRIDFYQGDIRDFDFSKKYDLITASLVMHHLEGDQKPPYYKKLYRALSPGGVFLNIDIYLCSSRKLQELFISQWREFMRAHGLSKAFAADMIRRHHREDRPVLFEDEIRFLKQAGFKQIDVVLKYYNFALTLCRA